mmetsp:Transcript_13883/g.29968  ORF Transcript_13883/g.29968 Transcript_13883/m.29968 type:complete len:249 (-) Transcript_13883:554-1300(-)
MHHLVGLQQLLDQLRHLPLFHRPHLRVLLAVHQLKVAELGLQILELLRDALVLVRQLHVLFQVLAVRLRISLLEPGQDVPLPADLALLLVDGVLVLVVALHQHAVVVLELLGVELVGGTHSLQVLLQVLDVSLQPDLEDVEVLCVRDAQRLQLLLVVLHTGQVALHEVLLHAAALVKQLLHLPAVAGQQVGALLQERVLNLLKLLLVRVLHLHKLAAHVLQQCVDVLGLPLEGLDKLIVLLLQLILDV